MKTALMELIEDLEKAGFDVSKLTIMTKYLAIEKEQIIDAHWAGWEDAYDYLREDNNDRARQAEEYYDETYQNK